MNDISFLLTQLMYQAPMLIVSLVGLILAAVNRNRCPTPAMLTILGCGLIFLVGLAQPVVFWVMMQQREEANLDAKQFGQMLSTIGLVWSGLRAIGVALVVIAVFMGRRQTQPEV